MEIFCWISKYFPPNYITFTHVLLSFLLILCLFITYLFIEIKQNVNQTVSIL